MTTATRKARKLSLSSILIDLLIDFAIVGTGFLIYYHLKIHPLFPAQLSPEVIKLLGGLDNAVLIIAGVPFVIGLLSILGLFVRIVKGMVAAIKQ
jgi:hypothetical protein